MPVSQQWINLDDRDCFFHIVYDCDEFQFLRLVTIDYEIPSPEERARFESILRRELTQQSYLWEVVKSKISDPPQIVTGRDD